MNTDLISIKQSTALEVLSSPDQVAKIIEEVKVKINTLDGGTLETGVGRKKIITNANKAKKSKTAVCKYIDDLVLLKKVEIRDKTTEENETIRLLLESKIALSDGLDQVYKDTRQAVTDFEAKLKAEKAEAKAKAEAEELAKTIASDYEIAVILMAYDFKEREEAKTKAEQEALADQERIKAEAAEAARIEAEQKAADEIAQANRDKIEAEQREAKAKQDAINREAQAKASEAKAKQDAIDAEKLRAKQQKKAEADAKKAKAKAEADAEAAAEKARLIEVDRQQAATKAAEAEQAARNADKERTSEMRRSARDVLIARHNLSPEVAQAIIVDIHKCVIPGLSINY